MNVISQQIKMNMALLRINYSVSVCIIVTFVFHCPAATFSLCLLHQLKHIKQVPFLP